MYHPQVLNLSNAPSSTSVTRAPRSGTGACGTRPDPSAAGAAGRTLPARVTTKGVSEDSSICG